MIAIVVHKPFLFCILFRILVCNQLYILHFTAEEMSKDAESKAFLIVNG